MKQWDSGVFFIDGKLTAQGGNLTKETAAKNTLARQILLSHNTSGNEADLKIKFDKLTSHDITYVGIIQTARASGLQKFPIPYVLTNCHNSLCAVGGTINEDDHLFGLSCAKKYGGVYVPPHLAVIHQYAREMLAECGAMILGSDSHTRYGALGTMAIGEGGGELAKQLLGRTYDVKMPSVVAIYLTGEVAAGVGPQDVALAIIKEVFDSGFVKNKVMEFVGPGVQKLSADFRIGIDVMTTETTCLSSIWETDDTIREYYATHGREAAFKELRVRDAYYDGALEVDLSAIKPMIAFPFHPSKAFPIEDASKNIGAILDEVEERAKKIFPNSKFSLKDKITSKGFLTDQALIAGCAGGGYENLCAAADILKGGDIGCGNFAMSVYPASQPIYKALLDNGVLGALVDAGVVVKTAFCGPCFGAGDTPSNNAFSIRHSTRNFPSREGSKPQNMQSSFVALMDARSIAATARNHGILTPATQIDKEYSNKKYFFDKAIYDKRVYNGVGNPLPDEKIIAGPNIKDWPTIPALGEDILVKIVSVIQDEVTSTDELIPSGETSSYRSNPLALAEFTLSRRDPGYVGRAKAVQNLDELTKQEIARVAEVLSGKVDEKRVKNAQVASTIYANKPGDGSAREQAASCQRVLGALCNIAKSYATKRYRSNLINWGMIPFLFEGDELPFWLGDYVFIPNIRENLEKGAGKIQAFLVHPASGTASEIALSTGTLTPDECKILLAGCLINFYKE